MGSTMLLLLILLLLPSPAFAYIDPGTGSLIFQALVAMLAGVLVFFNTLKIKVLQWLGKLPPPEESEADDLDQRPSSHKDDHVG